MTTRLQFDGERVIPENYHGQRRLFYYHWARYAYARSFISRSDTVVDIASGSGYGSYELAALARQVIAIDISEDAINYARARFGAANIKYLAGDAVSIRSLVNTTANVVVSFETIEHLDAASQRAFVAGVASILTDEGLFIVSTPNTLIYSGGGQSTNPFHLHELAPDDFKELLESSFEAVLIFGQRKFSGSTAKTAALLGFDLISTLVRGKWRQFRISGDKSQQLSDFEFTNIEVEQCPFLVAVCKRPIRPRQP